MARGGTSMNPVDFNSDSSGKTNYNLPPRTKAGEVVTFKLNSGEIDGNTQLYIRGVDNYDNVGNFGNIALNPSYTFNVAGQYLNEFVATGNNMSFRPKQIEFPVSGMNNIKKVEIKGSVMGNEPIASGEINLGGLWRLEYVDLSATSATSVNLPDKSNIKTLILPKTLNELNLSNQLQLNEVKIDSIKSIKKLIISNCPKINSHSIFNQFVNDHIELTSLILTDIDWKDVTISQLAYILNINSCELSGHITLDTNAVIDFDTKMRLLSRFGNIDSDDNALTITYTKYVLTDSDYVGIKGKSYVYKPGNYQFTLHYPSATGMSANDFSNIEWSISQMNYGTISNDGVFTYNGEAEGDVSVDITCRISRVGYSDIVTTKKVYLYQNLAKIGDYVYSDGTYGDPSEDLGDKTKIAVCFYVEGNDAKTQKRLAVSLNIPEKTTPWGLTVDVAGVPNCNSNGVTSSNSTLSTYADFYIDKVAAVNAIRNLKDMFTEGTATRDFGFNEDGVPCGKINTIAIIKHRDTAIQNMQGLKPEKYSEKGYKSEMEYLLYIFNQYTGDKVNNYFGPASIAYAYQPSNLMEGEVLDSKFAAHNWFLPSAGELIHLWYYLTFRKTADINETELEAFEAYYNQKPFNKSNTGFVWSSTEQSAQNAWSLRFNLNSQDRQYYYGSSSGSKTETKFCLPIVVF